jgi:phosphoglycolate phosphatase-like HAD superfamily hydrolase
MAYQCLSEKRKIYFKKDSAKAIGNVVKIIFDFDGVLVYTAESYRQTIRNVVDYYFLEILGLEGEKGKLATQDDIQKFKDTGLFNNDWNLSYSIIAYYLAIIIHKLQQKQVFQKFTKRFNTIQFSELLSFLQTLREVGDFLRGYGINATELGNMKNDSVLGLESFLAQANVKNQGSFETIIASVLPQVGKDEIMLVRKLIPYDSEKPDLLKRLFEESYLGKKLFSEFYGVPSMFKFDGSLLEKEAFIPTKRTLDALRVRSDKFAIYSEKPRFQGMYLLNKSKFKEYFDEKQFFFQEDLTESDGSTLGKPNPTFFIELMENISIKNGEVAYVGDGVADVLLVKNARMKGLSDLLFFGVLCSSQSPDKLLSQYVEYEADAIMTDVNDLPYLFANLDVILK